MIDKISKPDATKTEIVRSMSPPKDKIDLQKRLSLCTCLGCILKNLNLESQTWKELTLNKCELILSDWIW